jgi:hypothetical protein
MPFSSGLRVQRSTEILATASVPGNSLRNPTNLLNLDLVLFPPAAVKVISLPVDYPYACTVCALNRFGGQRVPLGYENFPGKLKEK